MTDRICLSLEQKETSVAILRLSKEQVEILKKEANAGSEIMGMNFQDIFSTFFGGWALSHVTCTWQENNMHE